MAAVIIKAVYLLIAIPGSSGIRVDIMQEKPVTGPEVFISGSIHPIHYNPDYRYAVVDLLEQIR